MRGAWSVEIVWVFIDALHDNPPNSYLKGEIISTLPLVHIQTCTTLEVNRFNTRIIQYLPSFQIYRYIIILNLNLSIVDIALVSIQNLICKHVSLQTSLTVFLWLKDDQVIIFLSIVLFSEGLNKINSNTKIINNTDIKNSICNDLSDKS